MAIRSMTGFGVSDRPWPERGAQVRVELRSVNARYLELKLRQPFDLATEHRLRRQIGATLGRGRVELALRLEGIEAEMDALGTLGVDAARVRETLAALGRVEAEAIREGFELSQPNHLELLRFLVSHRTGRAGEGEGPGQPPEFLEALVAEALAGLIAMREREGESLAATLGELFDELEGQIAELGTHLEGESERLFARGLERAQTLLDGHPGEVEVDRERLAQEIALLVVRSDVSEELARIASHLEQARGTLAAPAQAGQGKTLDFLAQELLREVTTIGSKISSHAGSALVIEAKGSVERIREQVQNVE